MAYTSTANTINKTVHSAHTSAASARTCEHTEIHLLPEYGGTHLYSWRHNSPSVPPYVPWVETDAAAVWDHFDVVGKSVNFFLI